MILYNYPLPMTWKIILEEYAFCSFVVFGMLKFVGPSMRQISHVAADGHQWHILLIWFNFNPSIDK